MKRSQINQAIDEAIIFFRKMHFVLPPFAYFTPSQWKEKGSQYDEIKDTRLGWDVSDCGTDDFKNIGRTIFTLRNGLIGSDRYTKTYAEKVMFLQEGQRFPVHYHKSKKEDIINHRGGIICVKVWQKGEDNSLSPDAFFLSVDGKKVKVTGGDIVELREGESIYLSPETYHQFWAKEDCGPVLSGEISSVNDDYKDNIWLEEVVRFPEIDEDEPRKYVLCSDYDKILS